MACVMEHNDFKRLLRFYELESIDATGIGEAGEPNMLVRCTHCGQLFGVEYLHDEDGVLFNYEDLLCPDGCNAHPVIAADFMEQRDFDRLERFFEDTGAYAAPLHHNVYFHLATTSLDN